MLQHQSEPNTAEKMREAAENLRKILREIAPYERKPKSEEISTAGTWRSSEGTSTQIACEDT
jgi:hypothetical protein